MPWKPSQPATTSHSSVLVSPACLKRIAGRIRHVALERPSPLSVPVLVEMGREAVHGEGREALLREATDRLIREAMA